MRSLQQKINKYEAYSRQKEFEESHPDWRRLTLATFTDGTISSADAVRGYPFEQYVTHSGKWGCEPCDILVQHDVDPYQGAERFWLPDAVITLREPLPRPKYNLFVDDHTPPPLVDADEDCDAYYLFYRFGWENDLDQGHRGGYSPVEEGPFYSFKAAARQLGQLQELHEHKTEARELPSDALFPPPPVSSAQWTDAQWYHWWKSNGGKRRGD